jgi:large subunit ribosomal protein L28
MGVIMARQCEITAKKAQFGNKVSHAQNKTRRKFNVNIRSVTLRSDILDQNVRMRIAASTIRTIDHNGGLDNFLLSTSSTKLTPAAVELKKKIKKAQAEK